MEANNYFKFLSRAKVAGVKTHMLGAFAMAFFFFVMFAAYAYSFYFGSLLVEEEVVNDVSGKVYTSGEIMTIFFGVLFGMFSLGMAMPNFKAVTEGRVAANMAYSIIERTPAIPIDDNQGKKLDLKGEIEFKGVHFTYPSRKDQKILDNFSCKFELGKTTALVGATGSGKSTIV